MTLQEIIRTQRARKKAYHADLDISVRYGTQEILTETVMVKLHKKFNNGDRMQTMLEVPAGVTIGQLMQLLTEAQPDHFTDSWFLEKLEPHYSGKIADEWSNDTQLLEYFVSTETSELVFIPAESSTDEKGWPLLPDGCIGFVSLVIAYPENDDLQVLEIPSEVSLKDATSFVLSCGIAISNAFSADITAFL